MKQALLLSVAAFLLGGCASLMSSAASGLTDSISDSVLNQDDPLQLGRMLVVMLGTWRSTSSNPCSARDPVVTRYRLFPGSTHCAGWG